jgi:hypothetical protein
MFQTQKDEDQNHFMEIAEKRRRMRGTLCVARAKTPPPFSGSVLAALCIMAHRERSFLFWTETGKEWQRGKREKQYGVMFYCTVRRGKWDTTRICFNSPTE